MASSPALNPETLLPASTFSDTFQSCPEVVEALSLPWPGNLDQSFTNSQLTLFVDRRSLIDRPGNCQAAYAVVTATKTVEAIHLLMRTSSQKVKFITLTRTLYIAKGEWGNIYTDSKYVFLIAHIHSVLWRERGFLTIKNMGV